MLQWLIIKYTIRLKVFTLKGAVEAIFLPINVSENIGKNNNSLRVRFFSAVLSNE